MKRKYRRHSEEFKGKALQYSTESSKSITQICIKKAWGCATDDRAVGESGSGAATEPSTAELADEVCRLR